MRRLLAVTTTLLLATGALGAERDEERAPWRFRRSVALPGAGEGFAALGIPPELAARAQADLRDLRLLDAAGQEVPYVVDRLVEREARASWPGHLVDTLREPVGTPDQRQTRSVWVVEVGGGAFDTVNLDVLGEDFAKRFRLESSQDRSAWRLLRDDVGIFDRSWNGRIRHTSIALETSETARYLRLSTTDTPASPQVEITGVTVFATRRGSAQGWRRPVPLEVVAAGPTTRYRLDLPPAFPIEALELDAADPAFVRQVTLRERRESRGQSQERTLGEARLYRVRLTDLALSGASLELRLHERPRGGELLLDVDNGDGPPLRDVRIVATGSQVRLLFARSTPPLTLYYGNDVTRPPIYGLDELRGRLALGALLPEAELGEEQPNPRFQRPAPLPFAPARGAAVEPGRWRFQRRLNLEGAEDLRCLILGPDDIAVARGDLGDIRLVDAQSRQVPYVLEAGVVEARVPFELRRTTGLGARSSLSRYRLSLKDAPTGRALSLPVHAIELDVAEGFFERRGRILVDAGDRRGERIVWEGSLRRAAGTEAPAAAPISIATAGERLSEVELQIDEGDNAPLSLGAARALVRVPRLTFKASSGEYRLLLGNRDASGPRYDMAGLRQEVLAYSAVRVEAGSREANPSYRRLFSEHLEAAPSTLVLWTTLLLAAALLLLLTARVLRAAPAPPEEPDGDRGPAGRDAPS